MNYADINPFIRFADIVNYKSKGKYVLVQDCRIFFILSGTAEIYIDNTRYTLCENSLFFVCEKSVYKIEADNVLILSVNFDLDQSRSSNTEFFKPVPIKEDNVMCGEKMCSDIFASHIFVKNALKYLDDVKKILTEFSKQQMHYREICGSVLKIILCNISRDSILPATMPSATISKLISYIDANYNKDISNRELAAIAGYHEYYLNRIFKKYMGQSIHKYILSIRIKNAKSLLHNDGISISDIAETIGFGSISHFSSYFKKVTGLSPFEYRDKFSL